MPRIFILVLTCYQELGIDIQVTSFHKKHFIQILFIFAYYIFILLYLSIQSRFDRVITAFAVLFFSLVFLSSVCPDHLQYHLSLYFLYQPVRNPRVATKTMNHVSRVLLLVSIFLPHCWLLQYKYHPLRNLYLWRVSYMEHQCLKL